MPGTPTPNYDLILPLVNGDKQTWSTYCNTNWTSIDGIMKTNADTASAAGVVAADAKTVADAATVTADAALPLVGGTITGPLTLLGAVTVTEALLTSTIASGIGMQVYRSGTAHSAEVAVATTGEVTLGPVGTVWGKVIASTETEATTDDTLMTRKLGDERYIQDIPAVSQPVKAWAKVLGDGTVPRQTGIDTVVRNSTGNYTVTLTEILSTADYVIQLTADCTTTTPLMIMVIPGTQTTNQFQVAVRTIGAAVADPVAFHITVIDG